MNKKNSGKITIANIVSLLGLVSLAFLVFCGYALQNPDGNIGVNIIVSASLTALVGFLLWLLVYAKGVENNFKGWLIVEITTAVLFLGTAFFTGSKMMYFFVVSDNMKTLKECAQKDIKKIEDKIQLFKEQEKARLHINKTGIINAIRTQKYDKSVEKFLKDNNILETSNSVNQWYELKVKEIDDIEHEGKKYKNDWNKNIGEIKNIIESWNLFLLPNAATRITNISEATGKLLTTISEQSNIVKIESSTTLYDSTIYIAVKSDANQYKIEVNFPSQIKKSGFSFRGFFLIVLINGLIIFNYIFAYRSKKVRPKNNKNTIGGTALE